MAGGCGSSPKELGAAERRIAVLSDHLCRHNSTCATSQPLLSRSLALRDNSYTRVHGEVPTHEPEWFRVSGDPKVDFTDIIYEKAEGIAKITINRPDRRNCFSYKTVKELMHAFNDGRDDSSIGVIILTGNGTKAFCSGGDQALQKSDGSVGFDSVGPYNILDLQAQIRRLPKPVIAMVAGYAVGGGNVLQMVCDITIAADNAVFGQTGPRVGSFDAGFGCSVMSRLVGPKKAKEMWFLTRFYDAKVAEKMGLVNIVVPLEKLEAETIKWCREVLRNSPTAIRVLKSSINAIDDGHVGLQVLGGDATLLFYGSEGNEGRKAYLERRRPDFSKFPRKP